MTAFMIGCAFVCGIFGALTGAFEACFLAGVVGVLYNLYPSNELLNNCLYFGFIPYVAFTGAVCGTASAGNIRKHDLGGADIAKSLHAYLDPSVLIVSGLFAIAGSFTTVAISKLGIAIDGGSIVVFLYSALARIIFGDKKFINKNFRNIAHYNDKKIEWVYHLFFGLVIGAAGGYSGKITGNAFLPFFFSLAALLFCFLEPACPYTHHITCIAAYAFTATGSIVAAAVWGGISHVVMVIIGDLINTEPSTHIDPPATTIGLLSIVIWLIYSVIL